MSLLKFVFFSSGNNESAVIISVPVSKLVRQRRFINHGPQPIPVKIAHLQIFSGKNPESNRGRMRATSLLHNHYVSTAQF